ncbi:MAG TPA: hypothetical protein PKX17_06440 [Candidatus Methanomethylicus sp.]|nr:hypothetical protein [Candidatus Methanomethylicus sp.]
MPPENGNTYVTRREWELVMPKLDSIEAKVDATNLALVNFLPRAEYDHHRDVCNESIKRLHDRLESKEKSLTEYINACSKGKVSWAVMALVSLLSSAVVGISVALILRAIGV